jgi:hemerythrin-like domain-containing protein
MVLLHTEDKSGARNAPGRAIRPTEPIESAGRNHPLETLLEAHRRNEQFLRVLQLLVQQPPGGRLESHELSALELALRYFAESRPLHHLDEEESIFPRLEGTALEGKIRQLAREHEHLDGLHAGLGAQLQAWVAQGRLEAGQRRAMQATLRELVNVLRQHRMVEEEEIFPFAKQSFSAAVWARIDQEFAARRK